MVFGFGFLIWGADRFVEGASGVAKHLGVSPLLVGLTIVGFGTSAPELLVSSIAALDGNVGISVGNAIGSNIANASLVLGAAALVAPFPVRPRLLKRELPALLMAMAAAGALMMDGWLSRADGIFLLGALLALVLWVAVVAIRQGEQETEGGLVELSDRGAGEIDGLPDRPGRSTDAEIKVALESLRPAAQGLSLRMAVMWLLVGFLALLGSARVVVWGAVRLAEGLGVDEAIVGLTVVALGTSLPELAATVVSAWKKQHDLAFGNVIGSNFFNTLGVLGLPGLLAPGRIDAALFERDYPVMMGISVLGFVLAWRFGLARPGLGRIAGALLLAVYFAYGARLAIEAGGVTAFSW